MTTNSTTHTAASLAALAPRELDALAHETVFQDRIEKRSGIFVYVNGVTRIPIAHYSTDLSETVLLERELERRGLIERWALMLLDNSTGGTYPVRHPDIESANYEIDYASVSRIARFSPCDRTIAAILAVQDSPYLQIVTWDKHPKDAAANSQSASDSPDA